MDWWIGGIAKVFGIVYNKSMETIVKTAFLIGTPITYITTADGRCIGGHTWTYSGGMYYVLNGTPCDCGLAKYETSKKCETCGRAIAK